MTTIRSNATLLVPVTLASLFLGGCAAYSRASSQDDDTRISDATISQIEMGKTRWHFLQAAFGDPNARRTVKDIPNYEIWTYSYERVKESNGAVLFAFVGSSSETERHTAYFELTDWVITKAWVE